MDQRGAAGLGGKPGDKIEQGLALDIAVGAETRRDLIEVGVVIAGVAAELVDGVGFRRKGIQCALQRNLVEIAGGGYADGALRSEDAGVANLRDLRERRLKTIQQVDLEATDYAGVVQRAR